MKVVDLTEFKLKVKVVRAHNLVPLTDSGKCESTELNYCSNLPAC